MLMVQTNALHVVAGRREDNSRRYVRQQHSTVLLCALLLCALSLPTASSLPLPNARQLDFMEMEMIQVLCFLTPVLSAGIYPDNPLFSATLHKRNHSRSSLRSPLLHRSGRRIMIAPLKN